MHLLLQLSMSCCLGAATLAQSTTATVSVRIVDPAGRSLPGATVWTLPSAAWDRLAWIPAELTPYWSNPHELLRRLGRKAVADEAGAIDVPPRTIVAAEHGDLAGVANVVDARSPFDLRVDGNRWTIDVRDAAGTPVAGVPVVAHAGDEALSVAGLSLGLTDATGRLVVRAPRSIDFARYIPHEVGVVPRAPEFARLQVDGMYLREHAVRIRVPDPTPPTVTLILPPVTKVEVRVPDWNGPLFASAMLTRTGKGQEGQEATCWTEAGKLHALVGVQDTGHATRVRAKITDMVLHEDVEVPRVAAGATFAIDLALDQADIVLRARVQDAVGRAAELAYLEITPRSDALRTWWVHADRQGRFVLVLRHDLPAGTVLTARVHASPDPGIIGAVTSITLPELPAGSRHDVGTVTLAPK